MNEAETLTRGKHVADVIQFILEPFNLIPEFNLQSGSGSLLLGITALLATRSSWATIGEALQSSFWSELCGRLNAEQEERGGRRYLVSCFVWTDSS